MSEIILVSLAVIAFCLGLYVGRRNTIHTAMTELVQPGPIQWPESAKADDVQAAASSERADALFEEEGGDAFGFAVQIFGDAKDHRQAMRLIFNALNGWNKQISIPTAALDYESPSGVRVSGSGKALECRAYQRES